jgi:hypothetical protein
MKTLGYKCSLNGSFIGSVHKYNNTVLWEGGPKIVKYFVTSFMDDPTNSFLIPYLPNFPFFKGTNGKFFYILEDPSGAFEIDSRTGVIRVKNSALFDREKFEILQVKFITGFFCAESLLMISFH